MFAGIPEKSRLSSTVTGALWARTVARGVYLPNFCFLFLQNNNFCGVSDRFQDGQSHNQTGREDTAVGNLPKRPSGN